MKYITYSRLLLILGLFLSLDVVRAAIPQEYNAVEIKAPFSFTERVFDLTKTIEIAKKENKNIFLYMGGADCPPCKEYELFLKKNHEVLKKSFANVVIGDIQTWVRGPNIHFVVDGKKITIEEFRIRVGDKNKRNVTPTIWLLDKNLQQIRQLPQFTAQFFLSIERHKELLE